MSLLFLDIDGVLNGHKAYANGFNGIDPHCMTNLNYIIEQTGCVIIISSAWRYMIPDAMTIKGFEYMLRTHGFNGVEGQIIGITERDEIIPRREDQIMYEVRKLNIRWAVVDDLPLNIENFVRTDGRLGLQHQEAIKLIEILKGEESKVSYAYRWCKPK